MSKQNLLRASAFFTLFTFVGHTIGVIKPLSPDQVEVISVYNLMKQTLVPMPMGATQSLATLMLGANVCLSILLFLAGVSYLFLASDPMNRSARRQLWLLNLSMLATAITSGICFFPLPAICLGLAAVFGIICLIKPQQSS